MATDTEKQRLIETLKFTPRTYKIQLWGGGSEIAVGKLTKEQYDFWSQEDEEDIIAYCVDAHHRESEAPKIKPGLDFIEGGEWYDNNNWIDSTRGCYFSFGSFLNVLDEDDKMHWSTELGRQEVNEEVQIKERTLSVREDHKDIDYWYRFQSAEDGHFWLGELELQYPFDHRLLEINTVDFEGTQLVTALKYNGEPLWSDDYNTHTDNYHCHIIKR